MKEKRRMQFFNFKAIEKKIVLLSEDMVMNIENSIVEALDELTNRIFDMISEEDVMTIFKNDILYK